MKQSAKILVILTGGTIGSKIDGNVINVDSASAYSLIHLYEQKYGTEVQFEVIQPYNILSENLLPSYWNKLYACLEQADWEQYDGVIIAHGSDTVSYTAAMMGYCFKQTKVPIVLIASNYALQDPRSNGLSNFRSAVCLIREKILTGVFVAFQNEHKENIVYLATRLQEADPYRDQFSSFGGVDFGKIKEGHFEQIKHQQNPSMEELSETKERIVDMPEFHRKVLLIHPYPGFDYRNIHLDEQVGAVLHTTYHSATACGSRGDHSAVDFALRCRERGIPVYASSFKGTNELYATSAGLLEAGVRPLVNISTEAAYTKLLLAYNQKEIEPDVFMRKNIYYEILPELF